MNLYTVSLFGHREMNFSLKMEQNLSHLIKRLISNNKYVEFLIGRNGSFDLLAAAIIRRETMRAGYQNSSLVLVLPYMTAEYRNNAKAFQEYYNEIELIEEPKLYFKTAISIRNQRMIDRSDLVIFGIDHSSGGAYQAFQYAQRKKKEIYLL